MENQDGFVPVLDEKESGRQNEACLSGGHTGSTYKTKGTNLRYQ